MWRRVTAQPFVSFFDPLLKFCLREAVRGTKGDEVSNAFLTQMRKIPIAGTTFVLLMSVHVASAVAQRPDSVLSDSAARARADSARLEQDLRRIRGEPRARAQPTLPASAGQPLRVSRQQAINEALTHNATLVIFREQISQARARVTQSTALPEPSVGATVLGQTGLLRIAWDNGDRTVLGNPHLRGVTFGWDLSHTAADELFAAIEGTAFSPSS